MNNPTAQQQQQQQLGVIQGNNNNVGYPTMVQQQPQQQQQQAPTAMTAEAVQQQMSYLMNSGLMANPLFQQLNGNFMLQQQQQQQQQQQHLGGGTNNNNSLNQQQQQAQQQLQQQQVAPNGQQQQQQQQQPSFDFSQMMNYNAAAAAAAAVAQPQHITSATFATNNNSNMGASSSGGAKVGSNAKRSNNANSNAISDDNHSTRGSKTDRAKLNRDRNREHARSTRERKKAYVQKLRELVEKLHAERNEESRKRRVAVQHLAEIHRVRCDVVHTFLRYHSKCEHDERRWTTILEDDFWLKQPVTPYRSFHRAEIEKECRLSRGVSAIISDAASVSVMLEMIGHLTPRWVQLKRQHFITYESMQRNQSSENGTTLSKTRSIPRCLTHQESRSQRVFSSLSSSDDLSSEENPPDIDNNCSNNDSNTSPLLPIEGTMMGPTKNSTDEQDNTIQSREDRSISSSDRNMDEHDASKDFHDYNAMPLPDPKIKDHDKNHNSDSCSSSEDSAKAAMLPVPKRRKLDGESDPKKISQKQKVTTASATIPHLPSNIARKGGISHNIAPQMSNLKSTNLFHQAASNVQRTTAVEPGTMTTTTNDVVPLLTGGNTKLPPNIAKKGGISHNIRPVGNGEARLDNAPAIVLPPFRGLGNKSSIISTVSGHNLNEVKNLLGIQRASSSIKSSIAPLSVTSSDVDIDSMRSHSTSDAKTPSLTCTDVEETSSSSEDGDNCMIRGSYHINQDSQILMGDILMCPFVFRSHDAVSCGALSECLMPGMLRAEFSTRNKLKNLELTYDAMGFMQQLARASGNDSTAQIIPSSVEMALTPSSTEARVITMAKPPYLIMNVNEQWTRLTGYTQMDAEGKEYLSLIEGEHTIPTTKANPIGTAGSSVPPTHVFENVVKGRPVCSTNIHYDKAGADFIEFVASFPLTNDSDAVTHILHISKELPSVIRETDY